MSGNFVVAIVGPTACGKTALSIALSKQFNGQVICCDSRTVYKYMDIGTAKPGQVERLDVPHHMLDIVEPDQSYTAAEYAHDVGQVITSIQNSGALPIVCGGTGLYFKAALEGLNIPEVPPNAELRDQLNDLANSKGNTALHSQLVQLDPLGAEKIHANDRTRVVRALEVSLTTGLPFSQVAGFKTSPYDILWIGLNVDDRAFLQARIYKRLQAQIECGLLEEVRMLYSRFGDCRTLTSTINYSEFITFLTGKASEASAQELCLKNNYQLARRQIMWFKRNQDINWFFIDRLDSKEVQSCAAKLIAEGINLKE